MPFYLSLQQLDLKTLFLSNAFFLFLNLVPGLERVRGAIK